MIATNSRPAASVKQRWSQCILLAIPLIVTGIRANGGAVSAHGTLIVLHEPLLSGQNLTLTNVAAQEGIICKVIDINAGANGTPEIGVEFAQPCPHFWRVSFSLPESGPRSPETKWVG